LIYLDFWHSLDRESPKRHLKMSRNSQKLQNGHLDNRDPQALTMFKISIGYVTLYYVRLHLDWESWFQQFENDISTCQEILDSLKKDGHLDSLDTLKSWFILISDIVLIESLKRDISKCQEILESWKTDIWTIKTPKP
jgi:hypothetical protein